MCHCTYQGYASGDCIKKGLVRENSDPVMIEDVSSSIHEESRILDKV